MEAVTWLRPEYQDREDELIHLADGAALVGVSRSAVSNWAARHANFPGIVLLTGSLRKRTKFVVRDEFVAFARQQLSKPRGGRPSKLPARPRATIRAGQVEHLEAQVARLTALEARQAAQATHTRAALADAKKKLQGARDRLAAELHAAQQVATTRNS